MRYVKLQAERDKLRHEAHEENSDDDSWVAFRAVRNKIYYVINLLSLNGYLLLMRSRPSYQRRYGE